MESMNDHGKSTLKRNPDHLIFHVRAHVLLTMASYPKQLLVQLTELAISLRNGLLDVNIFKP